MILDYNQQLQFTKSIQIDDIGNFALRCTSDIECEYYIIVATSMGKTSILKFGPIVADLDILCNDFSMSVKRMNFKETAIEKEASSFINDGKKKIIEAVEVDFDEALSEIPEINLNSLVGD